jgi:hypothetical protein
VTRLASCALWPVLFCAGCGVPVHAGSGAPTASGAMGPATSAPAPVAPASTAHADTRATAAPPVTAAPTAPVLITDEECLASGGEIVTEHTYADLRHASETPIEPFKICHHPSPKNGAPCRDSDECAGGSCYCTGELSGPDPADRAGGALLARDGTPGLGVCADRPIPSGSWYCLVVHGAVHLHGVIVD